MLKETQDNKYLSWIYVTLFAGILFRSVFMSFPNDIFCDEAMAGYDAWCLANYGIDQHMMSFPVYFKSWGSGQNALYTYLTIPFIKIFGLTPTVIRIPMVLLGCFSLLLLHTVLRKLKFNNFFIFLTLLFLAFNPWHITKSRWALESNLAPELLFIGTCFLVLGYYNKQHIKQTALYLFAYIFVALAAYGYATTWVMLPFFCILTTILLYREKKIDLKQIAICYAAIIIIAFPLLLFVYNIFTSNEVISLSILTIPDLLKSRHETGTILSMDAVNILKYAASTLKRLFVGYDGLYRNSAPITGQFFNPIGWIFIFITLRDLYRNRKNKGSINILEKIFLLTLLASIPLFLTVEYNANRWNVIWFALIYFCIKGIYIVIEDHKKFQKTFYFTLSLLTILFVYQYTTNKTNEFDREIGEHIQYVKNNNIQTVHYSGDIAYSTFLFYDPISPKEFNDTRVLAPMDSTTSMYTYSAFGRYIAHLPKTIKANPNTAYIIRNQWMAAFKINKEEFNIKEGDIYTTFWNE